MSSTGPDSWERSGIRQEESIFPVPTEALMEKLPLVRHVSHLKAPKMPIKRVPRGLFPVMHASNAHDRRQAVFFCGNIDPG